MMDVVVTGSSGLIGSALIPALSEAGHRPIRLVRRSPVAGADEVRWDPASQHIDAASLDGVDAVIHLAGVGIADRRWNDKQREAILKSRTDGTTLLARTLASLDVQPTTFISGSAVGYYGDSGDTVLTEDSPAGSEFLSVVCLKWEAAAAAAQEAGIRTVFARTGIVLSNKGGALAKQLPLFKVGLGGRLGPGTQWMSWITIDDEVRALMHLMSSSLRGPVNLTAPGTVTNAEFTRALGKALHRPAILPVPKFAPALLLGRDLAEQLLFWSLRVSPEALLGDGFAFGSTTIKQGLAAALKEQE